MDKNIEEAEFLEKELSRERKEEVSRMVEDLEREMALQTADKKDKGENAGKTSESVYEEPVKASRRRKKGSGKKKAMAAGIFAGAVILAVGIYFLIGMKYKTSFLPGTVINGADVSGMTPEEVKSLISEGINRYVLKLQERGGKVETITKDDIDLKAEFDGSLEKIIGEQEPNKWLLAKFSGNRYDIKAMISYDEIKLAERIANLDCMDEANIIKPENAYISEYISGQGYTVVPEKEGRELNPDIVREKAGAAVHSLQEEISLEDEGCYKEPEIRSDDRKLQELAANLNRYVGVKVTYKFGDKQEVLDGDTISQWLIVNGGHMDISLDGVKEYVQTLAAKYNTAYRAKTLKTSYGKEVTITRGNYGWRIDQAAEAEELMAIIQSGKSQEREPVYAQTAASHGENDYGDTYVEINLTAQHLFFYKDGELLVESDFVSGNVSKGYTTPPGAYPLTYKERNATLKGQGYASPVSYWMPFNGGIGMHDASWRSSFGGTIYKTNGSHGCINLPIGAAKKIYENISKGMPVLCYNMDGTEKPSSVQTAAPPVQETEAAQETAAPEETQETEAVQETEAAQETPSQENPAVVQPTEPAAQPTGPGDEIGKEKEEPKGPGVGM